MRPHKTDENNSVQYARLLAFIERWQPRLLLILYFALLILYFIVPWLTDMLPWLAKIQKPGQSIAIIGMIGILLRPFLRLVENAATTRTTVSHAQHTVNHIQDTVSHIQENAATTRTTVSDIHEKVSQFQFPQVSVTDRQGINKILAAVTMHDAPLIFLGFKDPTTVKTVIDAFRARPGGRLYLSP